MSTHDLNRSIPDSSPTSPLPPASPPTSPVPRRVIVGSVVLGLVMIVGFFFCGTLALVQGNQAESTYAQAFAAWMTRYETALNHFDTLTQNPHPDDPAWQVDIQQQLNSIKAVDADMRAYQPPFPWSLNGWHKFAIQNIAANYDKFADLAAFGLTTDALAARELADRSRSQLKRALGLK